MTLIAYRPLEKVYAFHETAERWILRRYTQAVQVVAGSERRLTTFAEKVVNVFPERQPRRAEQTDAGQQAPQRCTIYLRTEVRLPDTTTSPATATDVLFDPRGGAWQAYEDGRWDEARGFAVVLVRSGRKNVRPWV